MQNNYSDVSKLFKKAYASGFSSLSQEEKEIISDARDAMLEDFKALGMHYYYPPLNHAMETTGRDFYYAMNKAWDQYMSGDREYDGFKDVTEEYEIELAEADMYMSMYPNPVDAARAKMIQNGVPEKIANSKDALMLFDTNIAEVLPWTA